MTAKFRVLFVFRDLLFNKPQFLVPFKDSLSAIFSSKIKSLNNVDQQHVDHTHWVKEVTERMKTLTPRLLRPLCQWPLTLCFWVRQDSFLDLSWSSFWLSSASLEPPSLIHWGTYSRCSLGTPCPPLDLDRTSPSPWTCIFSQWDLNCEESKVNARIKSKNRKHKVCLLFQSVCETVIMFIIPKSQVSRSVYR